MAKQQTRGLGADPLDAITGGGGEASPSPKPTPKKTGGKKPPEPTPPEGVDGGDEKKKMARTSIAVDPDVLERARRVSYWERVSLSSLIAGAMLAAVEEAEKHHGGPYPPVKGTQLPFSRPS